MGDQYAGARGRRHADRQAKGHDVRGRQERASLSNGGRITGTIIGNDAPEDHHLLIRSHLIRLFAPSIRPPSLYLSSAASAYFKSKRASEQTNRSNPIRWMQQHESYLPQRSQISSSLHKHRSETNGIPDGAAGSGFAAGTGFSRDTRNWTTRTTVVPDPKHPDRSV